VLLEDGLTARDTIRKATDPMPLAAESRDRLLSDRRALGRPPNAGLPIPGCAADLSDGECANRARGVNAHEKADRGSEGASPR
jgi:hypothetical protein